MHTVNNDQLVGLSEAARALGLTKGAVEQRRQRADFPRPIAHLASGPIWRLGQIRAYARDRSERLVEREGVQKLAADAGPLLVGPAEAADSIGVPLETLVAKRRQLPGAVLDEHDRLVGVREQHLGALARFLADEVAPPVEVRAP